jgi:hypothetical protein
VIRRRLLLAGLWTAGALLLPSSAFASKIEVLTISDCHGDIACDKYAGGSPAYALSFAAPGAEANDVTMTLEPDGKHIVVSDAGAPLTGGNRCAARDEHAAVCDVSEYPLSSVTAALGAGNDRFTLADAFKAAVSVDGGAGDDQIHGGSGADSLSGGPGADSLTGGPSNDRFPQGDTPDADVIDGGDGTNFVDYSARKNPLRVDLTDSSASHGETGEADTITRVQGVLGGQGADVIAGDVGVNAIGGGGGNDTVSGGAGDDILDGGSGRDRIDAGAGNDVLDPRDGEADTLTCGAGSDRVGSSEAGGEYLDEIEYLGPDARDRLAPDCENSWLDGWTSETDIPVIPVALRRSGNDVSLANPCRASAIPRGCKGTISVGKHSKRRFSRKSKRVTLLLDRRDRAAARTRPARLKIVLNVNGDVYSVDFLTTPGR